MYVATCAIMCCGMCVSAMGMQEVYVAVCVPVMSCLCLSELRDLVSAMGRVAVCVCKTERESVCVCS